MPTTSRASDQPSTAINRWTARLDDPEQERLYCDGRAARDLRQVRVAMIVAAVLTLGFAVLDDQVITDSGGLAVGLRLVWAIPGIGLALVLTYVPALQGRLYLFGWFGIGASTLFYLAINLVADTPDVYLSGYILILFFLQLFFPFSFPLTLVIGLTCTLVFAVAIAVARVISLGDLMTIYSQFLATLVAGSFAVYLLNRFRRQEFLSRQLVARQQQQYRDLLNRVFPTEVVTRMQAGEGRFADNIPHAAVLFADIVGFTEIAAKYPSQEVVGAIDRLFNHFDQRVARHGVEKVKTIGDAYLAVAGAPSPHPDPDRAIAALALDMLAAAATVTDPGGQPFRVRIGIHAGPVIAGVIGESRFGYDLWGDTVNLAARMQSEAEPGTIQVTETIHRDLADGFDFRPRGAIAVKGKGQVDTWYLVGRRDE